MVRRHLRRMSYKETFEWVLDRVRCAEELDSWKQESNSSGNAWSVSQPLLKIQTESECSAVTSDKGGKGKGGYKGSTPKGAWYTKPPKEQPKPQQTTSAPNPSGSASPPTSPAAKPSGKGEGGSGWTTVQGTGRGRRSSNEGSQPNNNYKVCRACRANNRPDFKHDWKSCKFSKALYKLKQELAQEENNPTGGKGTKGST